MKLTLPSHDGTFPSAVAGEDAGFESDEHVFDFSGVDTMPLAEYEGLSEDPLVCEPEFEKGGLAAFRLVGELLLLPSVGHPLITLPQHPSRAWVPGLRPPRPFPASCVLPRATHISRAFRPRVT